MSDAKPASQVLIEELRVASKLITELTQLTRLQFSPTPVKIYKPNGSGSGTALKLQLRVSPEFEGEFIKKLHGGLFLELAPQSGKDNGGNATFDWKDGLVKAKLGTPDVAALLVAIRNVRQLGKTVPEALRPKPRGEEAPKATVVSLFHKFESDAGKSVTVIEMEFLADGSFIRVSRSKELRLSIKLSLSEEYQVETALRRSLEVFQMVGKR